MKGYRISHTNIITYMYVLITGFKKWNSNFWTFMGLWYTRSKIRFDRICTWPLECLSTRVWSLFTISVLLCLLCAVCSVQCSSWCVCLGVLVCVSELDSGYLLYRCDSVAKSVISLSRYLKAICCYPCFVLICVLSLIYSALVPVFYNKNLFSRLKKLFCNWFNMHRYGILLRNLLLWKHMHYRVLCFTVFRERWYTCPCPRGYCCSTRYIVWSNDWLC